MGPHLSLGRDEPGLGWVTTCSPVLSVPVTRRKRPTRVPLCSYRQVPAALQRHSTLLLPLGWAWAPLLFLHGVHRPCECCWFLEHEAHPSSAEGREGWEGSPGPPVGWDHKMATSIQTCNLWVQALTWPPSLWSPSYACPDDVTTVPLSSLQEPRSPAFPDSAAATSRVCLQLDSVPFPCLSLSSSWNRSAFARASPAACSLCAAS